MRMLHSDSVRELVTVEEALVAPCDENGLDLDGCPKENLPGFEPEVPFRSRYATPFIGTNQVELVVDETTEIGYSDEDNGEEEENYFFDPDFDDDNPFEEEEDVSSVLESITPEIPVIIITDPKTGATFVSRVEEGEDDVSLSPETTRSVWDDLWDDLDYDALTHDEIMSECYEEEGGYGFDDREEYPHMSVEEYYPYVDDDEDPSDYYVDEWTPPAAVKNSEGKPTRRSRILQFVWEMGHIDGYLEDSYEHTDIQDRFELHDHNNAAALRRSKKAYNRNDCDRSDARWQKNVGRHLINEKSETIRRYLPGYNALDRMRFAEAQAAAIKEREEMIKDWLAGRRIFVNPHGWYYWCHPIVTTVIGLGVTIEKISKHRQGIKLTPAEFRFFDSLSVEEQYTCFHPKSREKARSYMISDHTKGWFQRRSNSWKFQKGQNRQWESPHKRQGHEKVVTPSFPDERSIFERVLDERLLNLEVKMNMIRSRENPDWDTFRSLDHEHQDISLVRFGCFSEDAEEIFWRIRNNGYVPMDVQDWIANRHGANSLVAMLIAAGLTYYEAYQMEDARHSAAA